MEHRPPAQDGLARVRHAAGAHWHSDLLRRRIPASGPCAGRSRGQRFFLCRPAPKGWRDIPASRLVPWPARWKTNAWLVPRAHGRRGGFWCPAVDMNTGAAAIYGPARPWLFPIPAFWPKPRSMRRVGRWRRLIGPPFHAVRRDWGRVEPCPLARAENAAWAGLTRPVLHICLEKKPAMRASSSARAQDARPQRTE